MEHSEPKVTEMPLSQLKQYLKDEALRICDNPEDADIIVEEVVQYIVKTYFVRRPDKKET